MTQLLLPMNRKCTRQCSSSRKVCDIMQWPGQLHPRQWDGHTWLLYPPHHLSWVLPLSVAQSHQTEQPAGLLTVHSQYSPPLCSSTGLQKHLNNSLQAEVSYKMCQSRVAVFMDRKSGAKGSYSFAQLWSCKTAYTDCCFNTGTSDSRPAFETNPAAFQSFSGETSQVVTYFISAEILKCEVSSPFLSQVKKLPVILHYNDTEREILIISIWIPWSNISNINSLFPLPS